MFYKFAEIFSEILNKNNLEKENENENAITIAVNYLLPCGLRLISFQ
jgi:hypothetical protein